MSSKKRTEAWDRTRKAADQLKPMADQMKPFADKTRQAAMRQWFRTRAWAAPQVERTGKVLEDTVAPKVSAMLSSAAERIDPARPRRGRWRLPIGIAAALSAAAGAAAAALRNRSRTTSASSTPDMSDMPDITTETEPTTDEHQANVS